MKPENPPLETDAEAPKTLIKERNERFRGAPDRQYQLVL
jgi:hypothetical protein